MGITTCCAMPASRPGARPKEWAQRACNLYYELLADRVIAERNYGGDMVGRNSLRNVDETVSYKDVNASKGKLVRAGAGAGPCSRKIRCIWSARFPNSKKNCAVIPRSLARSRPTAWMRTCRHRRQRCLKLLPRGMLLLVQKRIVVRRAASTAALSSWNDCRMKMTLAPSGLMSTTSLTKAWRRVSSCSSFIIGNCFGFCFACCMAVICCWLCSWRGVRVAPQTPWPGIRGGLPASDSGDEPSTAAWNGTLRHQLLFLPAANASKDMRFHLPLVLFQNH